jgi:head-tail adaptor
VRGETVTFLRRTAGGRDAHGNITWTWTETAVPGCVVWPTGSTEQLQDQDQTSERLTVLAPYGTDVTAYERATVRGLTYEVKGVPSQWASPFTATRAGVEARLERVRG